KDGEPECGTREFKYAGSLDRSANEPLSLTTRADDNGLADAIFEPFSHSDDVRSLGRIRCAVRPATFKAVYVHSIVSSDICVVASRNELDNLIRHIGIFLHPYTFTSFICIG